MYGWFFFVSLALFASLTFFTHDSYSCVNWSTILRLVLTFIGAQNEKNTVFLDHCFLRFKPCNYPRLSWSAFNRSQLVVKPTYLFTHIVLFIFRGFHSFPGKWFSSPQWCDVASVYSVHTDSKRCFFRFEPSASLLPMARVQCIIGIVL